MGKHVMPGIRYKQGDRTMYVTTMRPRELVVRAAEPDKWNPVGSQPHGNRPLDQQHFKDIAEYLQEQPNYILSAVVLYLKPSEIQFEPLPGGDGDVWQTAGTLSLDEGAEYDVGDGQHRIFAYSEILRSRREYGGDVFDRVINSGQPVVIVADEAPLHRAEDFSDLQRSRPVTASMAHSMDRRKPVNKLLLDLVQDASLPVFGKDGDAGLVEFEADTVGKLSAKLFSFKVIRYASGTALGITERNTRGWEKAADDLVSGDRDKAHAQLHSLWSSLGALAPFTEVINGKRTAADLRSSSYLTSAGVLYAIAYAAYLARQKHETPMAEFTKALKAVNFDRPGKAHGITKTDTIFAGNLIDPDSGRIAAGRTAWEAAGVAILDAIGLGDPALFTAAG